MSLTGKYFLTTSQSSNTVIATNFIHDIRSQF